MSRTPLHLGLLPVACVAALLFACSSDETTPGDGDPTECPRGTTWDGEACVPSGGGRTDAGGGSGTPGVDGGGGGGTDTGGGGGLCTPGETRCDGEANVLTCNEAGDGFASAACAEGEACFDGACIPGGRECNPGEVRRCVGDGAREICDDDGINFSTVPCPADSPNCFDGECTSQICVPDSLTCEGQNVVECSSEGDATTIVETCELGCARGRCIDECAGDGKDYRGCSFYAVDLDNFGVSCTSNADCDLGESCDAGICEPSASSQQFAVTVSNTGADAVDVTIFQGSGAGVEVASGTVNPGELASYPLPRADINDSSISGNSFRVESTGPVTVHQFNPQNNSDVFSNDASLLLPATSLGNEYVVVGWPTAAGAATAIKSWVTVTAVDEGSTDITITTPTATAAGPGDMPPAMAAGETRTFTLTQGQVLSMTTLPVANADLTGMSIEATQPIAVFSGAECANVPLDNQFCDHLEQQLFPVDTWGVEYAAGKFRNRGREPDVWRVVAAEDGTLISTFPRGIGGIDGRTINRGEFLEFESDDDFVIFASQPFALAQFMVGSSYPGSANGCNRGFGGGGCAIPASCSSGSGIGDPAFLLNVPVDQYLDSYLFLVPAEYQQDYVTVTAPVGTSLTLDGSPVPITGDSVGGYDFYRLSVADGVHTISGDGEFGLYVYGYDCDVSYAYPGGLDLEALR